MIDTNNLSALPAGWVWTRLGEFTEIILGQSPPSSTYNENNIGLPFYQGKAEFGKIFPVPQKWCCKPKKNAKQGDVLISVRAPVGPTNICPEESCIGRGLAAIRGLCGIKPYFILYLLRKYEQEIATKGTGSTFDAISGTQLKELPLPLPPLQEQHRIVTKIEELFTKLDAGLEALKKVKSQLKRYRQSVLKHAFCGKLTEEWRESHKDELEPASVLLERIMEEREKSEKKKGKKEIGEINTEGLQELPVGWGWVKLGDIEIFIGSGITPKGGSNVYVSSGIPFIRSQNVYPEGLRLEDVAYITDEIHEKMKRTHIKPRDVLLNITGASIGRSTYIPENFNVANVNQHVCIIRTELCLFHKYLSRFLNSPDGQKQIFHIQVGVTRQGLNYDQIRSFLLPLPSLPEQHRIVEEIERRFSISEEVEKTVDYSLKQAEKLRQSILKSAFSGRLVPQDPSDEPAEELLKRIKEERERNLECKNSKKTGKKKLPSH